MPVAWEADIFESYVGGLYTCLVEPLGYAMGIRTVIACLAGDFEHGNSREIYEFVRGFLLHPAWNELWPVCFLFANRP